MSATNRGTERKANDLYETPEYTIQSLMNVLDLTNVTTFLEPCVASGNIMKFIPARIKRFFAEISKGINYLIIKKKKVDLIITNPPYSLATKFLDKSLQEAGSVWYLLRINFLESEKRVEWWQGKEPTHLLALSSRPSFMSKGNDATGYAWYGWDKTGVCKLKPGIHVLPYNKPNGRRKKKC